jgi:flagellar protein FlgJ
MTSTAAAATFSQSIGSIGDAENAKAQSALKFKANAKSASEQFEATFVNAMFQHMFTDVDGEGPFGGGNSVKVWRSLLTDQYAKSFAKNGGLGIASHVYDQLLKQQGVKA